MIEVPGYRLQVTGASISIQFQFVPISVSTMFREGRPSGGSKHRAAMFAGDKTMSCYALQAKHNIKPCGFAAGLYVLLTLMPAICGIILVDI